MNNRDYYYFSREGEKSSLTGEDRKDEEFETLRS